MQRRVLTILVAAWLMSLIPAAFCGEAFLVPMDGSQQDHCRGYGLVYQCLLKKFPGVAWLLNYRGGSFLLPPEPSLRQTAEKLGVSLERLSDREVQQVLSFIAEENMDVVPLETAPRIGIYLTAFESKEHDIVARTLDYAGIPFKTIYDGEILSGGLKDIDWLHIHHKDFTGQGHRGRHDDGNDRELATAHGFSKIWRMKQKVAQTIHEYVGGGGFLFAMCSAAETIDIALAARDLDIVPPSYDGDPADPNGNYALNFQNTFAFGDFHVNLEAGPGYSDIDVPAADEDTRFTLFDFSATVDPIPCLLNQNHTAEIPGFGGETSSFRRSLVKKNVIILGENNDGVSVRYLCGYVGKGVFCFYGGHTPGTMISHFKSRAAAFRLILNNVLFPAAKTKKRKT